MEGIPELLKNMLLVMGGMDIFYELNSSPRVETQLCRLTCDRLNTFLPALKRELFPVGEIYFLLKCDVRIPMHITCI